VEQKIENKVANSSLVSVDLKDYYAQGKRVSYDLKQNLFQDIVLKEKEYRGHIKGYDWSQFKDCYVAIHCSVDAIIPSWAYLLLTLAIQPFAKKVVHGSISDLEVLIFEEIIDGIDFSVFQDQRVIIKGCSDVYIPNQAYVKFVSKLQPLAKSIMFGEACSTVPLYKQKK